MFTKLDGTGRPPRPAQKDFLNWLQTNWDNSDLFVLRAPTGVGKTFVARSIQIETGAAILTCNNDLAAQYTKDYPQLNVYAGNSNYVSYIQHQMAREGARQGVHTVFNPLSYKFLRDDEEFTPPKAVVLDEADQFVSLWFELVSKKVVIKDTDSVETSYQAVEWLQRRICHLDRLIDKNPDSKAAQGHRDRIEQYTQHLRCVTDDLDKYAVESEEEDGDKFFRLRPIKFPLKFILNMFEGSKVILMSATLFDEDVIEIIDCQSLSILVNGHQRGGLYYVTSFNSQLSTQESHIHQLFATPQAFLSKEENTLWHYQFGHVSYDSLHQLFAKSMAFLRMKLNTENIIPLKARDKSDTVLGCRQYVFLLLTDNMVGVDKIKPAVFIQAF